MKKIKSNVILALSLLICVLLFAGCGDPEPEGGGVLDSLEITLPSGAVPTIQVGDTLQLGVAYTPADTTLTGVTWTSSNPYAATIDDTGLVTAVRAGSTTITATSTRKETVSNTQQITVQLVPVPVTGIVFGSAEDPITEMEIDQWGDQVFLNAVVLPTNATNKAVIWGEPSDPTKVEFTSGGFVGRLTGLLPTDPNQPVTISVTTVDGDFTATCAVTVNAFVEITGITLSVNTLEVMEGASETLSATIQPPNATIQTITWESSDTEKATVGETGSSVLVNGLVITDTDPVTITATATKRNGDTVTASCEVTVIPFDGVEVFGWDAEDDPDFIDLPWKGEKTINGITVYNYSRARDTDTSTTPGDTPEEQAINGIIKAVQRNELVKANPDDDDETGFTMTKAGYLLHEQKAPCLQIGSNAWIRTSSTNTLDLTAEDGSPAIEGQFDLSKKCKITVEYSGIATSGGNIFVTILNNSGSLNNTNSPLGNDSGQMQAVIADGFLRTHTRVFDPESWPNYSTIKPYLEKAFFTVRAERAGTIIVVHSVKMEVVED